MWLRSSSWEMATGDSNLGPNRRTGFIQTSTHRKKRITYQSLHKVVEPSLNYYSILMKFCLGTHISLEQPLVNASSGSLCCSPNQTGLKKICVGEVDL